MSVLDSLPHPDRRGESERCLGLGIAPLVGSRGCYANCSFCCIAAWHHLPAGGPRFRVRPVEDLADEMAALHHDRGIDVFVFHDDNFFIPGHDRCLEHLHGLADALDRRGVERFGTVIKARPSDVTREVFEVVRDRLGCLRVFLGIESAADRGLKTLRRGVRQSTNERAIQILRDLNVYTCFNMLVFDPDATIADLRENLDFMERHSHWPWNFGRVELYAGTPLLARMLSEGRCRGDYMKWDYTLADASMQRVFELATRCFFPRKFAADALANRLQKTHMVVAMARRFYPASFDPHWACEAERISRDLGHDSVGAMRDLIEFVESGNDHVADPFVHQLCVRLRQAEERLSVQAGNLEGRIESVVGPNPPADTIKQDAKRVDT